MEYEFVCPRCHCIFEHTISHFWFSVIDICCPCCKNHWEIKIKK